MLKKLFDFGLISNKDSLDVAKKITVSSFLWRRFLTIVKQLKFVETLTEAETYIQHGHFMIGSEIARDPDLIISWKMEDHITWSDSSKIKRKVKEFNKELDDYDLLTN